MLQFVEDTHLDDTANGDTGTKCVHIRQNIQLQHKTLIISAGHEGERSAPFWALNKYCNSSPSWSDKKKKPLEVDCESSLLRPMFTFYC